MDEERQNAYIQLIEALLTCDEGEEVGILNANQDLIDEGLMLTIEEVAEMIAKQGNQAAANFLQAIAAQIVIDMGNGSSLLQLNIEATQLIQEAVKQEQNNQFEAALYSWQQVLAICRKIGGRAGEGLALDTIGSIYLKLAQYSQALKSFQQALAIHEEVGDCDEEGTTLTNIGIVYNALGQYTQAVDSYEQALSIRRLMGDREAEGTLLNNIGLVYSNFGQYPQALEFYQQALVIDKEIDNRAGEGKVLSNIWSVYSELGQYTQAVEFYEQALSIHREIGDRKGEGTLLNNIGSMHERLSQYSQALEFYQQALAVKREIGDREGEGVTLNNIGIVYDALGQYPQALDFYQQALAIHRAIGYRAGQWRIIAGIGEVYRTLGQYSQALEFCQQALTIVKEIDDRVGEGRILNNIGGVHDALGNYSQALEFYQQSLAIRQEVGEHTGEAITLGNIGGVHDALGNYSQALEFYQQSLAVHQEVGSRAEEGAILNNIGNVYNHLEQYPQALEFYRQALAVAQEIGNRAGEGAILNNMGFAFMQIAFAFMQTDKMAEAEKKLREALEVWESLRAGLKDTDQVSIFETQTTTYRFLQQALIALNKIEDALEIAERGRARAFVELLAERLFSQSANSVTITPPTIKQIKQIAQDQNCTLVEYSLFDLEEMLLIWVIKPDGESILRLANLEPLQQQQNISLSDLVIQARKSLGVEEKLHDATSTASQEISQPIRHISQPLRQLHQYLIQPIINFLPSDPNAPVIFIPQGTLFLVPFPALQDSTGKFLIEQHTLLTAPSIQVLELTRRQRQRIETINEMPLQSQDVLVVGNPTMPRIPLKQSPKPLDPLPGSEVEAKAIASLFNTQPIIGDEATKVYIETLMPKARLIHLATHGLLDDIRQLGVPGAIALAPSDEDNGFLTAGEILEMKLKAELVVLSACSSGQGKITGDGVIGLSRCLFAAGVPSVIVSLWKVGDNSTQFLMSQFYQNLQSGMNKAQSLRQAMLTAMKKKQYSRPKSWAAFILIGEAE